MTRDLDRNSKRPISLLICALGGEGGGVLAEWLVNAAAASGFAAQSTSIPGVAQRTGSTTYYVEVFPVPISELGGKQPVFSLYPVPGALDALVSSELLETVRQISNGMVSPDRTQVVTSTSRALTTAEKMQLGDGRTSTRDLLEIVRKYSRVFQAFDMSSLARETGTVVSAVLLGAIAGSGLMPFPRSAYEETIRGSNRGVAASLTGFARAFECVQDEMKGAEPAPRGAIEGATTSLIKTQTKPVLPPHVSTSFPQSTLAMISLGYARMIEYQDRAYGDLYLSRLSRILDTEKAADRAAKHDCEVTCEVARYLALWMAFDDIVRVADLKCRASRTGRVHREVSAQPAEIVRIYDFFKPGVPELAALLPDRIAQALVRWDKRRIVAGKSPLSLPLKVGTHTVFGYLALRSLAGLRWLRKRGARFAQEQAMIERWLDGIRQGLQSDWQVGSEIAQCGRLIKGYGTTNERGKENLLHVLDHLATMTFDSERARAEVIAAARASALADDTGKALDETLTMHGALPRPVKAQAIVWMKKPQQSVSP